MRNWRVLAIISAALTISACTTFEAVRPEQPIVVANRISIAPQVMWARPAGSGISDAVWTIDGFGLNELHFLLGRKAGDTLFKVRDKQDLPVVKAGMLPNDAMDLVVNSLTRMKNNQVRASNLAPAAFGAANAGFRFDIAYVNPDGLEMRGMVLGAVRKDTLDILLFIAPNEYYFGKMHDTVERLFQSVQPTAQS
jgi:hypothetical protein